MSAVAKVTPLRQNATMWLSPEQVCDRVPGMTVEKLEERRKKRLRPDYFKPTLKTVVYDAAEIDAWIASSRITTREQS